MLLLPPRTFPAHLQKRSASPWETWTTGCVQRPFSELVGPSGCAQSAPLIITHFARLPKSGRIWATLRINTDFRINKLARRLSNLSPWSSLNHLISRVKHLLWQTKVKHVRVAELFRLCFVVCFLDKNPELRVCHFVHVHVEIPKVGFQKII